MSNNNDRIIMSGMIPISCTQPMPHYNALILEERQKFGKLVHDLLRDNKWMLLEEAQRIDYRRSAWSALSILTTVKPGSLSQAPESFLCFV